MKNKLSYTTYRLVRKCTIMKKTVLNQHENGINICKAQHGHLCLFGRVAYNRERNEKTNQGLDYAAPEKDRRKLIFYVASQENIGKVFIILRHAKILGKYSSTQEGIGQNVNGQMVNREWDINGTSMGRPIASLCCAHTANDGRPSASLDALY